MDSTTIITAIVAVLVAVVPAVVALYRVRTVDQKSADQVEVDYLRGQIQSLWAENRQLRSELDELRYRK